MRTLLSTLAAGFLLANLASADEVANAGSEALDETVISVENESESSDVAPQPPNTLMRVKSGISFSRDDGDSSSRVPVTFDWEYIGFPHIGVGASFSSAGLALGSLDYRYQAYPIRFTAGLRAGNCLFRSSQGYGVANRVAAGPAVNFDYAVSGPYFVNASVDYLFAENSTRVSSIQVGFGAEF